MSFPDPPTYLFIAEKQESDGKVGWGLGTRPPLQKFILRKQLNSTMRPLVHLCATNNCVCYNVLSCPCMGFNYTPGVCNQSLWECPYPPQLCSGAGRETSSQQGNSLNRHMHLPHWILQRLLSISTPGGKSFDYPTGGMWAAWRSIVCALHVCCFIYSLCFHSATESYEASQNSEDTRLCQKGQGKHSNPF